ncbi:hypothetical protein MRX96_041689 [Rhipicephalus microplus]
MVAGTPGVRDPDVGPGLPTPPRRDHELGPQRRDCCRSAPQHTIGPHQALRAGFQVYRDPGCLPRRRRPNPWDRREHLRGLPPMPLACSVAISWRVSMSWPRRAAAAPRSIAASARESPQKAPPLKMPAHHKVSGWPC